MLRAIVTQPFCYVIDMILLSNLKITVENDPVFQHTVVLHQIKGFQYHLCYNFKIKSFIINVYNTTVY